MKTDYKRPIGEILHIVNNEAICFPLSAFKGKGWRVFVDEEIIGTLGDPFGNVDRPYQPIILKKDINKENLVGKEAFAQKKKKKKRRNYKKRKKNS